MCLRRRSALNRHDHYATVHEGRAVILLPLHGNIERRPTRCWVRELSSNDFSVLSREPMEPGERFLLRLPRESSPGLWLRCRTLCSRASEHDDLYIVVATFESQADLVGLRHGSFACASR